MLIILSLLNMLVYDFWVQLGPQPRPTAAQPERRGVAVGEKEGEVFESEKNVKTFEGKAEQIKRNICCTSLDMLTVSLQQNN